MGHSRFKNPTSFTVCQSKRHLDTEFEAVIFATKIGYKFGEEMEPYPCGGHWHITHIAPTKRRGFGEGYKRCPHCKKILKCNNVDHKCDVRRGLGYE